MQYRPIAAGEVKDFARLMRLAFGDPAALTEHYTELLGIEGYRGLFDGERMVASIGFFDDAHHFAGGAVSTWGVTAVGVDPGTRGRGLSGILLDNSIKEAAAAGPAMMTLYASAPAVYRKVGFERAGKFIAYKGRTAQMASSGSPTGSFRAVDPMAPETRAQLIELHRRWLPLTSGPFERRDTVWTCLLQPYDKHTDVFVWHDDADDPGAYAILHHTPGKFEVADYCVPTGQAASAMLGFLGGFRAIYSDVIWRGALVDPLIMAMNDRWWETEQHEHWFSRIVDVRKALAQRGYAKGVGGRVVLSVEDPVLAHNNGTFGLEVANGTASVETDGDPDGSLQLTVQSLVPLFTGLVSASRLAAMGRLDGPREAIEMADLLFIGPTPWMEEQF
ncbi:MAG: GNAT family N-acetyltransferase [Pseudomonadota bacterium]